MVVYSVAEYLYISLKLDVNLDVTKNFSLKIYSALGLLNYKIISISFCDKEMLAFKKIYIYFVPRALAASNYFKKIILITPSAEF